MNEVSQAIRARRGAGGLSRCAQIKALGAGKKMSDVFPVLPTFSDAVHASMNSNIRGLEGLREDREFLAQSRAWMEDSLAWTRGTIQYETQRVARETAAGRVPQVKYLGYLLGLAVLKGRHILACERLLA